jgi:N-acetylglutamate synthase-like GNAT family acetyltransferase
MIEVRKIQPKDLETLYEKLELLRLDESAVSDKIEDMMLVLDRREICGAGCGVTIEDKCLLNWIYIARDYRLGRLGTALVKTILNNSELSGAKEAYICGNCDRFAASLKFNKVEQAEEIQELERLYRNEFGDSFISNFYKADLTDYFKPCCNK